jgi:DNA-binding NarL/FixJ family response regulator
VDLVVAGSSPVSHPTSRGEKGLRARLATEPDIESVGEAGTGRQAVQLAGKLLPDVVVIEIAGLTRHVIAKGMIHCERSTTSPQA